MRIHSDTLKMCRFQKQPVFIAEILFDPHTNKKRKRMHQAIWFISSNSMNIKTSIGNAF